MSDFFSIIVKAGETKELEIPLGANLVLRNAALEASSNKDSAKVILSHGENRLTICTLIAGSLPQYRMNILVNPPDMDDEDMESDNEEEEEKEIPPASITVEGKGTVHIVGNLVPAFDEDDYFEDEDDEDDEDEDGEDDDVDMDDDDEDDEDEEDDE